jgi:hypothetical protein
MFEMKITLKLFLAAAPMAIAIFPCSEPALARGGGANIMNSPGYQRRLQESRQQLPQSDARASFINQRKPKHKHLH